MRGRHWDDVEKLKKQVSILLRIEHSGYADYIEVGHFPHKIKAIKKSVFSIRNLSLVVALSTRACAWRSGSQEHECGLPFRKVQET